MSRPNVLLLILDSVRARNVGAYGYHRNTTPFLSSYVERATQYQQARAPGIHSVASHASIWTGDHVKSHQVIQHEDELKPDTTIWEDLSDKGYTTGIFTTNPVVAHASNLSEQFNHRVTDEFVKTDRKLFPEAHGPADIVKHEGIVGNLRRCYQDDQPVRALVNSVNHFILQQRSEFTETIDSSDIVQAFEKWHTETSEPWAACINLMDAHFPYEPATEYNAWADERLVALHDDFDSPPVSEFIPGRPWWQLEALEHLYDGTICQLDAYVERVVSYLKRENNHDDTLVVITSDHGEGFGEVSRLNNRTKMITHSWGVHEVLSHVPLVVKYPNQSESEIIENFASLVGFPETVRKVFNGSDDRRSFITEDPVVTYTTRLREEDDAIFEESEENVHDYYGPWQAVYERSGDTFYKYIRQGERCETVNLGQGQEGSTGSDVENKIQQAFDSLPSANVKKGEQDELSDDIEEKLTDLGYLR